MTTDIQKINSLVAAMDSKDSDSKQSQVYYQIKTEILNNTYPPGTLMVERKLCEIYKVSRSPIRNALQKLTHDGLLTIAPGKGMVVSDYTIEDILEIYDLLETLQIYGIRTALKHMTPASFEMLESILNHMQDAIAENNLVLCHEWDQEFHTFIIACSPNRRLAAMYEQLRCQNIRFIITTLEDSTLANSSYTQHVAIFNAIKDRDLERTTATLHSHYKEVKQYYIDQLKSKHFT